MLDISLTVDAYSMLTDGGNAPIDQQATGNKKNSKKPKYSKFTQQELPACKLILTPRLVISALIVIAVLFIPIGLAALAASDKVVEIIQRYDKHCVPQAFGNKTLEYIRSSLTNKTCTLRLTVPKEMQSPLFVYYQLDNFYQNHRRYVKSRNDKQLRSKAGESQTADCQPEMATKNGPIVPCGLVAWSLFNDTYKFSTQHKALEVSKKDIAWGSDKRSKFGSDVYPKNFQNGTLVGGASLNSSIPLSEQEDLIVWMRTAALPTFRKLYGRIEQNLKANDVIEVVIQNNYNSYGYKGKKKLIISTTSWIGGKNKFLGIAYLKVGGLCLVLALGFILVYLIRPRPLGDPSYLSWNKNPEAYRR